MAFTLGGRELPSPTQQMEKNSPVQGVGIHRRAYGRIEIYLHKVHEIIVNL